MGDTITPTSSRKRNDQTQRSNAAGPTKAKRAANAAGAREPLKYPPVQSTSKKTSAAPLPSTTAVPPDMKAASARYYSAKAVFGEFEDLELIPKYQDALDTARSSMSPTDFTTYAASLIEEAKARQKEEKTYLQNVPPEKRALTARAVTCIHKWKDMSAAHPEMASEAASQIAALEGHIESFKTDGGLGADSFKLLIGRSICDGVFLRGKQEVQPFKDALAAKTQQLTQIQSSMPSNPSEMPQWQASLTKGLEELANAGAALKKAEDQTQQRHEDAMRKYDVMR